MLAILIYFLKLYVSRADIICLSLSSLASRVNVKHDILVKIENINVNENYDEAFLDVKNVVEAVQTCRPTITGTFSFLFFIIYISNVYKQFSLKTWNNLKLFFLFQAAQTLQLLIVMPTKLN